MVVTMIIRNSNFTPKGIFSPANTLASVIANEFTEVTGDLCLASLIEWGLVLFIVTPLINLIGKLIMRRMGVEV